MSAWRDDEPVDGAGLPLRELSEEQRGVLVAELRNALRRPCGTRSAPGPREQRAASSGRWRSRMR